VTLLFRVLVEAAGSASRVRKSTRQDFYERILQFSSRPHRRLQAGFDSGQPRKVPRLPGPRQPREEQPAS